MIVKQAPAVLLYSVVVLGAIVLLFAIYTNDGGGGMLKMNKCEDVVFKDYSTNPEEVSKMFDKINQFRVSNGKDELKFSDEALNLAEFRVKDMVDYEYYAHTNPVTGDCSEDIKSNFRINDSVSESIFGLDINGLSPCASWEEGDTQEVLDEWFSKENTRNNLLYSGHTKGAVTCLWDKCVFIGLNQDNYGNKCISKDVQ